MLVVVAVLVLAPLLLNPLLLLLPPNRSDRVKSSLSINFQDLLHSNNSQPYPPVKAAVVGDFFSVISCQGVGCRV
ncbi:MAG: hypothetical protein N4J56_000069 [Chroococcidiopsis sp. SAG 2025]|nr:hypothetical protein [Chroococcidiopsis sp. SAG 2025]